MLENRDLNLPYLLSLHCVEKIHRAEDAKGDYFSVVPLIRRPSQLEDRGAFKL